MSSVCWITALRKLKPRGFSNTNLEETTPLHRVLISDLRGPWSWLLVAQCEQQEMLAPASCPCTLKAKVLPARASHAERLPWAVHIQLFSKSQPRALFPQNSDLSFLFFEDPLPFS